MAQIWYISRNGGQAGPCATLELQQMAAAGQLSPLDFLWKEGMTEWLPAGESPRLFPQAAAAADSPPAAKVNAVQTTCFACYAEITLHVEAAMEHVACPECGQNLPVDPSWLNGVPGKAQAFAGLEVELTERIRQRVQEAYAAEARENALALKFLGKVIKGIGE